MGNNWYYCLQNESWFKKVKFLILNQILQAQHNMDVSFISGHY